MQMYKNAPVRFALSARMQKNRELVDGISLNAIDSIY